MNLKKTIPYNLNVEEFAEWCEDIRPKGAWIESSFALMEVKDKHGNIFQIQVKATRDQSEFLDNPRIDIIET